MSELEAAPALEAPSSPAPALEASSPTLELPERPRLELAPADVCAVFVLGVWHPGIALGARDELGDELVIHCSRRRGRVAVEPWRDFVPAPGLRVTRCPKPAELAPEIVLARAHARLGRPWSLHYNCEHFVRDAYDAGAFSAQAMGAAGTFALICLRRALVGI